MRVTLTIKKQNKDHSKKELLKYLLYFLRFSKHTRQPNVHKNLLNRSFARKVTLIFDFSDPRYHWENTFRVKIFRVLYFISNINSIFLYILIIK
jgi:hypothetical protein